MSNSGESKVSVLLVTGLLAAFGTIIGGFVEGHRETNLARMDFQSKLILRALEPEDAQQRVASLEFLFNASLISDPDVRKGIENILEEGQESIPQFRPVAASIDSDIADSGSQIDGIVEKFPELEGKQVALIGFRVRHGDIVDAMVPIYAEVTDQFKLTGQFEGDHIGGADGAKTVLKKPGYVVTGIDIERGDYFGRTEVVHMQITWKRLTPSGIDQDSTALSEKLGSGQHATISEPPQQLRANENAFISDFVTTTSQHSSGELFLNNVAISETVMVQAN